MANDFRNDVVGLVPMFRRSLKVGYKIDKNNYPGHNAYSSIFFRMRRRSVGSNRQNPSRYYDGDRRDRLWSNDVHSKKS